METELDAQNAALEAMAAAMLRGPNLAPGPGPGPAAESAEEAEDGISTGLPGQLQSEQEQLQQQGQEQEQGQCVVTFSDATEEHEDTSPQRVSGDNCANYDVTTTAEGRIVDTNFNKPMFTMEGEEGGDQCAAASLASGFDTVYDNSERKTNVPGEDELHDEDDADEYDDDGGRRKDLFVFAHSHCQKTSIVTG